MTENSNTEQIIYKKDKEIGKKYFIKDNLSFATDYYSIAVMAGGGSGIFFFVNPTPMMIGIGILHFLGFYYLYRQRNNSIITSVTVYKYKLVFMDILMKSFKINKEGKTKLKKIFNRK